MLHCMLCCNMLHCMLGCSDAALPAGLQDAVLHAGLQSVACFSKEAVTVSQEAVALWRVM